MDDVVLELVVVIVPLLAPIGMAMAELAQAAMKIRNEECISIVYEQTR